MTTLILGLAILLLLGSIIIILRLIRLVNNLTPWLITCLSIVLLIGLNVMLIYQTAAPETSSNPDFALVLISLSVAAVMFGGLYYLSTDLTPTLQSEKQLRNIVKHYSGFLILKDRQFNYMVVNPAFAAFLGKDTGSIIGKTDFDFFPRSQANIFHQEDEQTLFSGKPITNDHEVRGVDGKKWLEITRTPYINEQNAVSGILITARDITVRKEAEISNKKHTQYLTTIQVASQDLMGSLDLSVTVDNVLSWGEKLTGLSDGFVCLVDPDESTLSFRSVSPHLEKLKSEKIKPGEDLAGSVWQSGQPLMIDNYKDWRGRTRLFSEFDIGAIAGLPLVFGSSVIGVIGFFSSETGQLFDLDNYNVFTRYCEMASLAIADSQAFTNCQLELSRSRDNIVILNHQQRLDRLLTRIATHFLNLQSQEIDQSIEQALQAIGRYTGVNRSYLFLFKSEFADPGTAFEWCSEEIPPTPKNLIALFNNDFNWAFQQLKQIETIHVSNSDNLPKEASELAEYLTNNGIRSFTAVPLESERTTVGFLGLDSTTKEMNWSTEELESFKNAADLFISAILFKKTALTLEQVRADEHVQLVALEQRNRESILITEMADLLQACRTSDEAYPIIARYIRQLIPDLSGALYLMRSKEDPAEKAVAWGEDRFDRSEDELAVNECWALRRGRLHLVTDPGVGPLCKHLTEPIPNTYLCIPLIAQGEAVGLLHLRSVQEQNLSQEQIANLQHIAVMMAEHIALALSNLTLRDELRSQAIRDPLTNLFNRRYMEETLVRELRRGSRHGTPVGLIMFDIDQMKPINDNLGHDAGDLLLKSIGGLLLKLFRGEDVPCRYGGDEFTIILPEASLPDVWRRAEEFREAVKKLQLEYEGKPLRPCTLSVGVTAFPDHGSNIESLIKASDSAIYTAKAEGGDRIMLGQLEEPV